MTMNKLDTMIAIKAEVFNIQERLNSTDAQVVKDAMEDYLKLVDIFYGENEDLMAPQQYEAAKRDFEYFMRLVELAYHLRIWWGEGQNLFIEAMNPGA